MEGGAFPPSEDSTQIRPPCRSTIFLQMASPMPLPERSERGWSRRKMPNTFSAYCGSISDAIVTDRDPPIVIAALSLNMDPRRLLASILDRVGSPGSGKSRVSCNGSPTTRGRGSNRTISAPDSWIRIWKVRQRLIESGVATSGLHEVISETRESSCEKSSRSRIRDSPSGPHSP